MNWPQLGYEYTVGGVFFAVTLFLCFRPGAGDVKNSSDRKTLIYLLAGFVGYFTAMTVWILLAS
jgi:hypothetical protein